MITSVNRIDYLGTESNLVLDTLVGKTGRDRRMLEEPYERVQALTSFEKGRRMWLAHQYFLVLLSVLLPLQNTCVLDMQRLLLVVMSC